MKFRLLLALALSGVSAFSATTNSISQFGFTWSFPSNVVFGTFANGDYWVVGPVAITNITPQCVTTNGRTANGSMLNPLPSNDLTQGYDSAMYAQYGPDYSSSLNVAIGVSAAQPLVIQTGSLVSSLSVTETAARPQLQSAAVLTVLAESPASGSFRPPYAGTNKAVKWTTNDLDYSKLGTRTIVSNALNLATVAARFERPWLDHYVGVMGQYFHPIDNLNQYGTTMAQHLAEGLLSLQLNYTEAQKELLLIRVVQIGIDFYGIVDGGAVYFANGGHNLGRKMPIMLAGAVLNDTNILAWGNASNHFVFQEDQQTWIVTQDDVGRPLNQSNGVREEYIQADVGIAEWGNQHVSMPNQPEWDGRQWDIDYRQVVGSSLCTHALTAKLMNLRTAWNWEPLFLYADRYWSIERNGDVEGWDFTAFEQSMMENYWAATAESGAVTTNSVAIVGTLNIGGTITVR